MSSVHEVAASIGADKEAVTQLAGMLAAVKDEVEELAGRFQELGSDSTVTQLGEVKSILEETESGTTVLAGSLEKARWQVMSAAHGTIGPGAQGSGPGGSIVQKEKVGGPDGGPPPGGLDAVPPHVRSGGGPSGEELMGVDPSIGPFQKEHENAGADRKLNPFQRGARSVVRNIGDFKGAADQLAKPTMTEMSDIWDPPETYPVVGTAEPLSTFTAPPQAHADYQHAVGNLVVVAALVAEWAARGIKNRKGQS